MSGRIGDSADFPFEEFTFPIPVLDDLVRISGSVMIGASAGVDVPGVGMSPALLFRFTDPFGQLYPATLLVLDDNQMAKLPDLAVSAVVAARRAAGA